jgi:Uma2 family endonuclease
MDLLNRHRLTVAQYHRMGEHGILRADARVELINGEIIDMAPTGSRHAGTLKQLAQILTQALGADALLGVQDPIILDDQSEPEPDLAVLRPRADFYKSSHPGPGDVLLIIEVADSSLRYDRLIKVPLYARHGIAEVWLVDIDGRSLSRFTDPSPLGYRRSDTPAALSGLAITGLPGRTLDLSMLFDD